LLARIENVNRKNGEVPEQEDIPEYYEDEPGITGALKLNPGGKVTPR